ncbi:TonB-dependent receptor [Marinoscillum sp. MHG1-6]|uniref:TonB-dependent receptor n=1 Tax=Marinoscillum sp. MHG1-6 TaxID=2959627 RepID=UPI00215802C0|nr:TonB-dependent receptor [Marinoscillum sp. MHG1-6]
MFRALSLLCLILIFCFRVSAQTLFVTGLVNDVKGEPIENVNVVIKDLKGTTTNSQGIFRLRVSGEKEFLLVFSHVQFETKILPLNPMQINDTLRITLTERTTELEGVEVVTQNPVVNEVQSVVKIEAQTAKRLPSAFGDFNKILVTLPGVASNNELSSAYSVRGGNFDENLVYVNDIPVYRPFLSNAGQQEGLSFVNPDMVENIEFYAGGWEAKYGDKLSSSLNIEYQEPTSSGGGATLGFLGGSAYYGGSKGRFSHITGVRHKDSRYLLGTLKTQGQYFPTYSDIQSLLSFDLTNKNSTYINKTKLNVLLAYGRNRYMTLPVSQQTQFGSVQANFRLYTAFEGREILDYDTYQAGFRLTHRFTDKFRSHIIASGLFTYEREQYDVEGAYRLCDVNTNSSDRFDECVVVRAIGSNYDYGRNGLWANVYTIENRNEYLLSSNSVLEIGGGATFSNIQDEINEYSFVDSADYVQLTRTAFNDLDINSVQYFAYIQNTFTWADSMHAMTVGVRMNYWSYNDELLISPRLAYLFAPKWKLPTTFKLSIGMYQQPPFYRELRNYDGKVQRDVYAQKSIHYIGSFSRVFYMWGRPFLFNSDVYYKQLFDLIPYDLDNVRLRYNPDKQASGYATGFDFRINGEFIKGVESWFSLGLMSTKENLRDDYYDQYFDVDGEEIPTSELPFTDVADTSRTYIGHLRRPTDQRIHLAVNFEDHMPNDPTLRINLSLVFGSGYPFGPPRSVRYRNVFSGDEYYRVDIGLSKHFIRKDKTFHSIIVRAEMLNALGADNTLSYTWIEDVYGNNFAIPNSLSARFLNLKVSTEF